MCVIGSVYLCDRECIAQWRRWPSQVSIKVDEFRVLRVVREIRVLRVIVLLGLLRLLD